MIVLFTDDYHDAFSIFEVENDEQIEALKAYLQGIEDGEKPELPEGVEKLESCEDTAFVLVEEKIDKTIYFTDFIKEREDEHMKNYLFFSTMNPDLSFCLGFKEEDAEKAARLAQEGFYAWNTNGEYPDEYEHFTEEDQERIEDAGYMDLSIELLDDAGIEYVELDWIDDSGEILPEHENDVTQIDCSIFE